MRGCGAGRRCAAPGRRGPGHALGRAGDAGHGRVAQHLLDPALVLYGAIALLFTLVLGPKTAQALALGGILIFGVAYLVAQGLADLAPGQRARMVYMKYAACLEWSPIGEEVYDEGEPPRPCASLR